MATDACEKLYIYIYIYIYIFDNIKWRKVKQARSYSNVSKRCNLCLWEKYFIICKPEMSTLNKRSELISTCRHSKKFLLNTILCSLRLANHLRLHHATRYCSVFSNFVYILMYPLFLAVA